MPTAGSRGGSSRATASRFRRRSRHCGDRITTTRLDVVDAAPRPIPPTQPAGGALGDTDGVGSGRVEILDLSIARPAALERLVSAHAARYVVAPHARPR